MASNFLLPSLLSEIVNLVSSLASDTTVKVFEKIRWAAGPPVESEIITSASHSSPPNVLSEFSCLYNETPLLRFLKLLQLPPLRRHVCAVPCGPRSQPPSGLFKELHSHWSKLPSVALQHGARYSRNTGPQLPACAHISCSQTSRPTPSQLIWLFWRTSCRSSATKAVKHL